VRAVDIEGTGATKTGLRDKFDFDEVAGTLEGISDAIKAALSKAAPDKVTIEPATMPGVEVQRVRSCEPYGPMTQLHSTGPGPRQSTPTNQCGYAIMSTTRDLASSSSTGSVPRHGTNRRHSWSRMARRSSPTKPRP
jgi:hypothetical protein